MRNQEEFRHGHEQHRHEHRHVHHHHHVHHMSHHAGHHMGHHHMGHHNMGHHHHMVQPVNFFPAGHNFNQFDHMRHNQFGGFNRF
ncbi:hypothetical protein M3193_13030 [Sporosarcina luteola]|uniref:hypothetical protein n=1 Tax=Sporosarcina luteola TaxID=582850 RepID=UPI00203ADFE4|nr:hypothetical protein [Sporosarcina luteola]MCM3745058.1 hypothetical protein [Sporosarcina luteola]